MKNFIAAACLLAVPSMLLAQSAKEMMTQQQIDVANDLAYRASRCRPGDPATANISVDPHALDLSASCPSEMHSLRLYYYNDAGERQEIPVCDFLESKKRDEGTPLLLSSAKRLKEKDSDTRPLSPVNRYIADNAGLLSQLTAKLNTVHSADIRQELEIRSTETWIGLSAKYLIELGSDYCDIFPDSFRCNRY
jgi:hypothetical protein